MNAYYDVPRWEEAETATDGRYNILNMKIGKLTPFVNRTKRTHMWLVGMYNHAKVNIIF